MDQGELLLRPPKLAARMLRLREKAASSDGLIGRIVETFGARVAVLGLGVVTTVLVARALGPAGRGIFAVATAVGVLGVQFSNLGLHVSNTYYVARDRSLLATLFSNALLSTAVLGGVASVVAAAVIAFRHELAPLHGVLGIASVATIPVGLGYLLLANLLIGIHDSRGYNVIEVATKILNVLAVLLLIMFGTASTSSLFVCGALASCVSFVWALMRLRGVTGRFVAPAPRLFQDAIGYGLRGYAAALFAWVVLRIDLFMVNSYLGAAQAGYYSVAVTLSDLLYMFPQVVSMQLFPTLTRVPRGEAQWRLALRATAIVGLIMAAVIGIAVLLARPMTHLLFGRSFLDAVPAFVVLAPAIFILSVNTILMCYFAAIGMPAVTIIAPALAAILNVVINMRLIPRLGIVGASLASLIAYCAMFACSVIYIATRRPHRFGMNMQGLDS